jgi:AAA domain
MPPRRGARRQTATKEREDPTSLEEAAVTVEIEDLASYRESTNILIHGPSGHGKTVLAGGAPNATFMSTEKGAVAAKIAGSKAGIMRVPTWEHVVAAADLADRRLGPDDWLIVDSLTKMQVLYIRWILRAIHEQNAARDLDIPAIQDHQKWQNGFKRFCDRLIDAPYNVIAITTSMYKEDENGDDLVIPELTGKNYTISNYVSSQFDVGVYYAVAPQKSRTEPMMRRALFQPYPPYWAKDRYNALGRWQDIEDGDYGAMADFIAMIKEAEDTHA